MIRKIHKQLNLEHTHTISADIPLKTFLRISARGLHWWYRVISVSAAERSNARQCAVDIFSQSLHGCREHVIIIAFFQIETMFSLVKMFEDKEFSRYAFQTLNIQILTEKIRNILNTFFIDLSLVYFRFQNKKAGWNNQHTEALFRQD